MIGGPKWALRLPVFLALILSVSGCVQTSSQNFVDPAAATASPLVLNGAEGAEPQIGPPAPATVGQPAPAAPIAAAATAAPPPPVIVAPAAEPIPIVASTPAGGTPEPAAAAPKSADAYPNINKTPAQPGGTLLPADERKRIISELEAMRAGQGKAPSTSGGSAALSKEAETHGAAALKEIEKCSEDGAAEKYPECAPAD